MRRQYHFRQVAEDTLIWDVHQLLKLSQNIQAQSVALTDIKELDEAYWFPHTHPTTQQIIEHMELVNAADLSYPIIVCAEGRVMDGMHRVVKAKLQGLSEIQAVKFDITPEPDFINVDEDDLDYSDIQNPK